jgi:hypothetical protein
MILEMFTLYACTRVQYIGAFGPNFMPPDGSATLCDFSMTRDENIMRKQRYSMDFVQA